MLTHDALLSGHPQVSMPVPTACTATLDAPEAEGVESLRPLAREVVERLRRQPAVALRFSAVCDDVARCRLLALRFAAAWRDVTIEAGAPAELQVEVDRHQVSELAEGTRTRTLLPHHDGGHCSYPTPSTKDDFAFDPAWRIFSYDRYSTTPRHKLYQGIFVEAEGDGLSLTTYLPWFELLHRAYRHQHGRAADMGALAKWCGGNVRRALEQRDALGARYLSLPAALGHTDPVHVALAVHQADAPFPAEAHARFPELAALVARCPCGTCGGEQERLWCHALADVTGESWLLIRQQLEWRIASRAGDLLVGHNLAAVHGGVRAGAGRRLEPVCLVVDTPAGEGYERWLHETWRLPLAAPDAHAV